MKMKIAGISDLILKLSIAMASLAEYLKERGRRVDESKKANPLDLFVKFVVGAFIVAVIIVGAKVYEVQSKYQGDVTLWKHKVNFINSEVYMSNYLLADMEGNNLTYSMFEGNISVLMVWATWCNVCLGNFPYLAHFNKMLKERGVNINIIPVAENKDTPEKVAAFYSKLHLSYDDIKPYKNIEPRLFSSLGILGVPSYYLLDKHGRAFAKFEPKWEESESLLSMLESLSQSDNE